MHLNEFLFYQVSACFGIFFQILNHQNDLGFTKSKTFASASCKRVLKGKVFFPRDKTLKAF